RSVENVNLLGEEQYEKISEQTSFKVLGFEVLRDGSPKQRLWEETINKIKAQVEKLNARNLLFKGKIMLAKSLVLSRMWYAAYILPPKRKHVSAINDLISNWIKQKSKFLPRYAIFQKNLDEDGLG